MAAIVGRDLKATARTLGTLARHNLVDLDAGEYTMLPPVLRFAIADTSDSASAARTRHRNWCLSLATLPDYPVAMLRREPDVRLAIDHALTHPVQLWLGVGGRRVREDALLVRETRVCRDAFDEIRERLLARGDGWLRHRLRAQPQALLQGSRWVGG